MFEAAKAAFIERLDAHSSESFAALEEETCQPEFLSEGGGRKAFAGEIDSCIVLACPGIWERTDAVFLRAFRSATADSSRKNKNSSNIRRGRDV
jgi:hypothetical protein